jgi:hypothetical protein
MKATKPIVSGPVLGAWLMAGAVVLFAPVVSKAINAVPSPASVATQQVSAGPGIAPANYSAPVADVVKLVDAKIDPEVILTYIGNSRTAYNLSATEIIALKDHGVGPDILTAMLQHDGALRAQAVAPAPTVAQAVPVEVGPSAPAYDYSAQVAPPAYTYAYPDVSYAYPSYAYSYPYYCYGNYNCGYYSPWYWPSYSYGCYPYWGYCGYPYCSFGFGYPYCYGGRGWGCYYGGRGYYGGHGYYGRRGYYGGHGYVGGGGYYGYRGRLGFNAGRSGGFRSFGGGARPVSFVRTSGGFRGGGGFGGHAASFGGHGGGHFGGRGR